MCMCVNGQTEVSNYSDGKQQQAFDDAQCRRELPILHSLRLHPDGRHTTDQPDERWREKEMCSEADVHVHTQIAPLLPS